MPKIVVTSINSKKRKFILKSGMNTIGREKEQDICLDDYKVTRRHARIQVDTEKKICVFEDLGSLNGSYLNNAKIKKHLLKENDIIEIGTHQLLFLAN